VFHRFGQAKFAQGGSILNFCCSQGSILPHFFEQKVASALHLAKKLPFNFTKDSVTESLNQNLAQICQTPFAIKGVKFCVQIF
jgi:hypothetical protein